MDGIRLGDVIDDYCVKCRRLTNHAIVSIVNGAAAKVRCRTCYHDHDYRHEIAPPTKKELKQAELYKQVLAGGTGAAEPAVEAAAEAGSRDGDKPEPQPEPAAAKKRARKTAK
jgi:hypothetical protein